MMTENADKKREQIHLLCMDEMVPNDIVNIGLHFFLKNVRPYAASCNES